MSEKDDLDPTPQEIAEAEALRKALEENASSEDADLLRSLALSHAPTDIDAKEHDAIIARALAPKKKPQRTGVVIRVAFGIAAAVAVAAGVVVVVRTQAEPAPTAELKRVRSTQDLFDKPFESKQTSARVDKIAMARGSDFRENRFTKWGVR